MGQAPPPLEGTDVDLGRAWREHRRHLLDVAFRLLGTVPEAEDAVQEAFTRLVRADRDEIDDVGGWLVVVTSRLCLDRLRSLGRRRTDPDDAVEDRLPAAADPADRVTLDESVRLALGVVLERLTPAERTAFVLHDVFGYPFDQVATVVGRTPAACRQLASRARRTVHSEASADRFHVEPAEHRRVADRFVAACATGDLDDLLAVLDPGVSGEAEVGGRQGLVTVTGAATVANLVLRFLGPRSGTTLLSLRGGRTPELVGVRDGRVVSLLVLTVADGRVAHIDGLADPERLAALNDAVGG
jgi:RNA polymerase sigma-70 factor (ECF subfamily)